MALTDKLAAIANAIRAKTGKTEGLTLDQMPTEIASITGGGGSSEDVRYVTFMHGDVELYRKPVAVGDDCVDVYMKGLIEMPTKESTPEYNFIFDGWAATNGGDASNDVLKNITEDKTVYAAYIYTYREYTITYYDSDGQTVLHKARQKYGVLPASYTPEKAGVIFDHWVPEPVEVTGDASYTAAWVEVLTIASTQQVTTENVYSAANIQTDSPTAKVTNESGVAWAIGDLLRVTFDGVLYEGAVKKFDYTFGSTGYYARGLGNPHVLTMHMSSSMKSVKVGGVAAENTGEPFFVEVTNIGPSGSYFNLRTEQPGTHTLSVVKLPQ